MKAIELQIEAARHELESLKTQLVTAETWKHESADSDSLSRRHSVDRARVEMIENSIKVAGIKLKREELLMALLDAEREAEESQQSYFGECTRYNERIA